MPQIALETDSRIVRFAGALSLIEDADGPVLEGDGWRYRVPADQPLSLQEVPALPTPWMGGAWRLDEGGDWDLVDPDLLVSPGAPDSAMVLSAAQSGRLRALADRRYQAEIAGIQVDGIGLRTDREAQSLLTGAALAALLDPGYSLAWKGVDGWVDLTAAQVIALAGAVRAHVQACFDRERALAQLIALAPDLTALNAVDIDAGWPAPVTA